jgi:hypothetical protein
LPSHGRRRAWARLGRALDLPLPALERPAWASGLAYRLFAEGWICLEAVS